MNAELKQQLETLYSAYSAKAGSDQTSALKEEMKSFLAYIAAANGVVAAGEVGLLNQFLDLKIHTRELANYTRTSSPRKWILHSHYSGMERQESLRNGSSEG